MPTRQKLPSRTDLFLPPDRPTTRGERQERQQQGDAGRNSANALAHGRKDAAQLGQTPLGILPYL